MAIFCDRLDSGRIDAAWAFFRNPPPKQYDVFGKVSSDTSVEIDPHEKYPSQSSFKIHGFLVTVGHSHVEVHLGRALFVRLEDLTRSELGQGMIFTVFKEKCRFDLWRRLPDLDILWRRWLGLQRPSPELDSLFTLVDRHDLPAHWHPSEKNSRTKNKSKGTRKMVIMFLDNKSDPQCSFEEEDILATSAGRRV
ncbi:hypothetical protein LTR35_017610 [Friedmanniomyces endolithicus]|uniref:Uncharacterized protein n=1 Tax=Friedmanniomyces endolithicus TaxID=329885 RepID=A0AAN6F4R9_9PEZI|nr:hypothetical protein LTR35_017610 [Friedmanniomyces endolithicus]KAK0268783.1 hypothetical protein LTS00_017481 [Friedmanniomyces endolithicus]KAK0302134.1 hypothetical protein LTR82_017983 [Friedmanniomyces endolithicus]KAK0972106.1 hypothetical protein LTR54_017653 [Friedmanniomyces endolithicus]